MMPEKLRKELKFKFVGKMVVYQHGGSLRVTIPASIVDSLGLISGSKVAFFFDENFGIVLMIDASKAKIDLGFEKIPLAFSVSQETAEKLRKNSKET